MSVHNKALFDSSDISELSNVNIGIIYTRWNDFIVKELVKGCKNTLEQHNVQEITTIRVPGAIELPFACKRYFKTQEGTVNQPDAIIPFGCVIQGETPHFDYVCQSVTEGITKLNLSLPIPILFGILTVLNSDQAKERIGGAHGHKGEEAAISALQMIAFNRSLM